MSALATSDKSRPPLLDAFLALKPNSIYTMGKPKEITSAASAFVQGAVESFQWGASGQLLEARMSGEGRPAILFTCENGKLRTSAQPEHAHTSRLVLPAIMTIMRILLEAKFHRDDLPPAILEKFRRQLKAPRREAQRPRVILTGGTLRRLSQTFVGPLTRHILENISCDIAFMGTLGLTPDDGLTTTDPDEAYTKELAIARARRVILLADATKVGAVSTVRFAPLSTLHTLVTDTTLPRSTLTALRDAYPALRILTA